MDKATYVYKKTDGLELVADVYTNGAGSARPMVLWVHGGALIAGNRDTLSGRFRQRVVDAGYVFATIEYRLAPETKVPGIREDVADALRWAREEGPGLFGVDPKRIALAGASAGGYLSLSAGYSIDPPPVIASFWGYGDITADWIARPQPVPGRPADQVISEEEARAGLSERPVGDGGNPGRGLFFLWCTQEGTWPGEVTGHDPATEPDAFDEFCPVRNVTADYPPTILVHGEDDVAVPASESINMAKALERARVDNELILIPDAGHTLDGDGFPTPEAVVADAHERVLAFIERHL